MIPKPEETVVSNSSVPTETARPERKRSSTDRLKRSYLKRVNDALLAASRSGMIADQNSLRRSRSWLSRLANGNSNDSRTNLFIIGKNQRGRVHKSYDQIEKEYAIIEKQSLARAHPSLRVLIETELEESNRSKMGSKSMFKSYFEDGPDKVQAVFSDKPIPTTLDWSRLLRARDRLVAEIPSQSIRLRSVEETAKYIRDPSAAHDMDGFGLDPTTNSGPPFYLTGWRPNVTMGKERLEYTQRVFRWIVERAKSQYTHLVAGEIIQYMAMIGQRTVNRGRDPLNDPKVKRMIIAMEKSNAVHWKMFSYDAMEVLKRVYINGIPVHNAWMDTPAIDLAQQKMLKLAKTMGLRIVSGDLSNFDATVVPKIWAMMAEGMDDWFFRAKKFFSTLNASEINNVIALAPDGIHGPCPSSIKSGSGGTNFIDCQYNKLALYYGEEMGYYKLSAIEVQGDDFCALGEGVVPESLSEAYGALGLTMHPDKQTYVDGALAYLQRLHVLGMTGGIASTWRVLNSVLVQERNTFSAEDWNPYMEAIQAIAKLDNAAFAPGFEGLVHYVKENDRFLLGSDRSAKDVISLAGVGASEILSRGTDSFSTRIMDKSKSGFALSPTNGVLRDTVLPTHLGEDRFSAVYSKERILAAKALVS